MTTVWVTHINLPTKILSKKQFMQLIHFDTQTLLRNACKDGKRS